MPSLRDCYSKVVHFSPEVDHPPHRNDRHRQSTILPALPTSRDYSRHIISRCAMTAVRDTLCNLRPLEIPRPHIPGLQFIPTKGRMGFYRSIRRDGAQFGLHIKPTGPRRPALADACWAPVSAAKDTDAHESRVENQRFENKPRIGQRNSLSSSDGDESHSSSQMSTCSDTSPQSSTGEPEYPEPDYDSAPSGKSKHGTIITTKF